MPSNLNISAGNFVIPTIACPTARIKKLEYLCMLYTYIPSSSKLKSFYKFHCHFFLFSLKSSLDPLHLLLQ
jgi:hypothetical protein